MRWSLTVARVRGIDIKVHATFVFLLLLGAVQWGVPHGLSGAVFGALLLLVVFACVALHELGHSVVAQSVGVQVREILLLPIGGVARLTRDPSRPWHELLIAMAGPLVNVVLAIGVFVSGRVLLGPAWFDEGLWYSGLLLPPSGVTFLASLLWANVGLAVFNMFPALPMDGGRVLRAVLAMAVGQLRATIVAAGIGRALALVLGIFGLFAQNPILVLIAAFVFFAAGRERQAVEAKAWLSSLTPRAVCEPELPVLEPGATLGAAAAVAMRTASSVFAVTLGESVVGAISRTQIASALERRGPHAYVAEVMTRQLLTASADDSLLEVHHSMMLSGQPVLILDGHQVIGIIGQDEIGRVLALSRHVSRFGRKARAPSVPAVKRSRVP